MKKVILAEALLVAMLAALMTLFLWKKTPKDVNLDVLKEHFESQMNLDGMEEAGDMRLKRAFSLNAADYDSYIYFTPDNTMSVNEFLVIKCKDESQIPEVKSGINKRLDEQKQSFDGYGTDQMDLLTHAHIYTSGNYVALMISRNVTEWDQFIHSELEE